MTHAIWYTNYVKFVGTSVNSEDYFELSERIKSKTDLKYSQVIFKTLNLNEDRVGKMQKAVPFSNVCKNKSTEETRDKSSTKSRLSNPAMRR